MAVFTDLLCTAKHTNIPWLKVKCALKQPLPFSAHWSMLVTDLRTRCATWSRLYKARQDLRNELWRRYWNRTNNYRTEKHQHSQNLTETCAIGIMTEWLWKMRKGTLPEQINIARIRIVGINRSTFQSFHRSRNVQDVAEIRTSEAIRCGKWVQLEEGPNKRPGFQNCVCRNTSVAAGLGPGAAKLQGTSAPAHHGPSWPSHLCLPLTSQNHPKSPFESFERFRRHIKIHKGTIGPYHTYSYLSSHPHLPSHGQALDTAASQDRRHSSEDQHQPWPPPQGWIASPARDDGNHVPRQCHVPMMYQWCTNDVPMISNDI